MSVRVLTDNEDDVSVLYDSVSEWAFGPLFHGIMAANDFLTWYEANDFRADLRTLRDDQLKDVYELWYRDTKQGDEA